MAIFANAKVPWPPQVKALFRILSAFNFNIEIVAPECIVPSVSYSQKFSAIAALPLGIAALLVCVYAARFLYKRYFLQQSSWALLKAHKPALVSIMLVVAYFLYLYITRLMLDVFNCAPLSPPDYDCACDAALYQPPFYPCVCPDGCVAECTG